MISVVLPTYNRAATILRAVNSVLNQTYSDIELIIVDDCSTDQTQNIITTFRDDRIRYIRHSKNMGGNAARNTGIQQAFGQYVAFQDSDDEWMPEKLDKQLRFIEANDCDLCFCTLFLHDGEKIKLRDAPNDIQNMHYELLKRNLISTQTILAKRKCFEQDLFDINMPRFQDWDLALRLSNKFTIKCIHEPLVHVYIQEDSVTKDVDKGLAAYEAMMKKFELHDSTILSLWYYQMGGLVESAQRYDSSYYLKSLKYHFSYKAFTKFLLTELGFGKLLYNNLMKK